MRDLLQLTSPLFFFLAPCALGLSICFLSPLASALNEQESVASPSALKLESKNPKLDPALMKKREPRVMEAAKMYEIYFLNQMMKAMRGTVQYSDKSKPSMGEGIYREQLDDQYVNTWADQGGVGLAELIHDDMVGKWNTIKEMKEKKKAGHKPMPLTDRDVLGLRNLPSTRAGEQRVLVSLGTINSPKDPPNQVKVPWECDVESVNSTDGKTSLRVRTLDGRSVVIAWDGVPVFVRSGDHLKPSQTVGELAKAARGILVTTGPTARSE